LDGAVGQAFRSVRRQTEALAEPLSAEDQVLQSMPDASPTKWHLAHTSWFFETFLLAPSVPGYQVFHPQFGFLFNSYYNAVGERHARPQRGVLSRPSLAEVRDYRRHVDAAMEQLLAGSVTPRALVILELGMNHEQQHQELLLTDIKHAFSLNVLRPAYSTRLLELARAIPALGWHAFTEDVYDIGHAGRGFSFDNEGPRHSVFVQSFSLASRAVTCGEYLEFIEDGGYGRADLWLSDGWDAVRAQGWSAPLYWEQRGGEWWSFTLTGMRPVQKAEPVCHVSYYEADAYARWAGARLPTEAEWEVAMEPEKVSGNLLEEGRFHPAQANGSGLVQGFGDVWEWTQSPYVPYPGYRPAEGALGEYNGKFMVNQLVLRGGSCATPRSHIRSSYRNFFPPGARWQFSGLRLARDGA
jgi:ergothioneine biosynthesis protein EgtB